MELGLISLNSIVIYLEIDSLLLLVRHNRTHSPEQREYKQSITQEATPGLIINSPEQDRLRLGLIRVADTIFS